MSLIIHLLILSLLVVGHPAAAFPLCPARRTFSGACSSLFNPSWGAINTPHRRLIASPIPLPTDLPSPRLLSNILCRHNNVKSTRFLNELTTFFGQFVDHNIVLTPADGPLFPIPVPPSDPLFANFSNGLPFHRSRRVQAFTDHVFSERGPPNVFVPINVVSSVLDLSAVYGPTISRVRALRGNGGKLKTSHDGRFLPFNHPHLDNEPTTGNIFFIAGDTRSNEHPVLTALHTLFVREHNHLVDELASKFSNYSDDWLFQTARAINIAQFQKITLEHFYPAMTGRQLPPSSLFSDKYVDASIIDVFATAAFRVGHTMVNDVISPRDKHGPLASIKMSETFFQPGEHMVHTDIDRFLRGAAWVRAQQVDLAVVDALRNHLFTSVRGEEGVDLVAMNIQRSRDNGLPSYNDVREAVGIARASCFANISRKVSVQTALSTAYGSVNRVEAWIGMVAEDHAPGAAMGETLIAVWELQFRKIRDGDRLYFRKPGLFPDVVTNQIARVRDLFYDSDTLRNIVLRNTDIEDDELPRRMFFV